VNDAAARREPARAGSSASARFPRWIGLGLGLLVLAGCAGTAGTARVFDGRLVEGPYVEPEAYAAFARGSYLAARGDLRGAEQAYREAARRDPHSPAIWTRLGVLACRSSLDRALRLFDSAKSASDEYAPGWSERARCLAQHGQSDEALRAAARALHADPASRDANLIIADLHAASGKPELARACLLGWALFSPEAAMAGPEFEARAVRLRDPALIALAAQPDPGGSRSNEYATRATDGSPRATALDQPQLSAERAKLLLRANPNDADALVLGLVSAALLGDGEQMRVLLRGTEDTLGSASQLGAAFADLLRWYLGDAAAAAWTEARRGVTPPKSGAP
jgi:tetratricopeptide (TPR) repeat protein